MCRVTKLEFTATQRVQACAVETLICSAPNDVTVKIGVFCRVTSCSLVDMYRRFMRNLLPPSSTPITEAAAFSETSMRVVYQNTRRISHQTAFFRDSVFKISNIEMSCNVY